ncbi:unnamed protein product [Aphanomyces euteiches]|uniref:2-dehydropantoate 2-reductase n=1 Tax=Aphanomyces euteiches TaxID=100861 RepID=A0A6G0XC57_9STRA|nr:hypothetical protein Ae201684_006255 [Aphanomyces euteiches]KAH9069245.1 hypothetical protein Ae201684P_004934 [Aphanomyces euteiches]KAH9144144.1 hypothetical protein AeRB84_011893 [Aphanomyces euteiches]
MKVGVVGLGAIGSLFFTRLLHFVNPLNRALKDKQSHIYAVVKESHLASLTSVVIYDNAHPRKTLVNVPTNAPPNAQAFCVDFDRPLDVLLVTVKSNQTYEVAARLKAGRAMGKDSLVISVQNGLGNVKVLKDILETDNVLHGVTYMGGTSVGPGHVLQGGHGPTIVQNADHLSDTVQETLNDFTALLSNAGIPTQLVPSNDLQSVLWTKLVVNAGINPLGAILNVPNQEVVAGPSHHMVIQALVDEAAAVAAAQGIPLQFHGKSALEYTIDAAKATGTNICSMCQDLRRGRATEIDAINDMVVTYGQEYGVPTPANELIVHLVKSLEQSKMTKD